MPRCVAINVGANTNQPGFRGPIYSDGSFEFVPIPETEPTDASVPTYGDLDLTIPIPSDLEDRPVHLDPSFGEYPHCEHYTYGDPYGVKASPLLELSEGDHVCFYATLTYHGSAPPPTWIAAEWGAYVIGRFKLASDPVAGDEFQALPAPHRQAYSGNAHLKRTTFDAAVLLRGDPSNSQLYDSAIPLSGPEGTIPNPLVSTYSDDSGRGPWWRRPLRYDSTGTQKLRALEAAGATAKQALVADSLPVD